MIVGISGKMGTGKTTLANYLVTLLGGRRVSFADALRAEVSQVFNLPLSVMTSRECKEKMVVPVGFGFKTVRELLQWWGTLRRETSQNYWVDTLLASVAEDELVFVDDVRYQNEARAIQRAGGKLIHLLPHKEWRPGVGADHKSETDLDDYGDFDVVCGTVFGQIERAGYELYENGRLSLESFRK